MNKIKTITINLQKEEGKLLGEVVVVDSTEKITKHHLDSEVAVDIVSILQQTIGRINSYDLH